jgi:hypothetical protein
MALVKLDEIKVVGGVWEGGRACFWGGESGIYCLMLVIVVCRCKQHAQLQFSLICLLLVRKISCGGAEKWWH